MEEQFVIFRLGRSELGLPIFKVREIIKSRQITSIPNMPGFYKGVINLRNKIIPILDLQEKLGMPKEDITDSPTLVVQHQERTIGLVVDQVTAVIKIDVSLIDSNANNLGLGNYIIAGIAKVKDKLILILDLEELLAGTQIVNLDLP